MKFFNSTDNNQDFARDMFHMQEEVSQIQEAIKNPAIQKQMNLISILRQEA